MDANWQLAIKVLVNTFFDYLTEFVLKPPNPQMWDSATPENYFLGFL